LTFLRGSASLSPRHFKVWCRGAVDIISLVPYTFVRHTVWLWLQVCAAYWSAVTAERFMPPRVDRVSALASRIISQAQGEAVCRRPSRLGGGRSGVCRPAMGRPKARLSVKQPVMDCRDRFITAVWIALSQQRGVSRIEQDQAGRRCNEESVSTMTRIGTWSKVSGSLHGALDKFPCMLGPRVSGSLASTLRLSIAVWAHATQDEYLCGEQPPAVLTRSALRGGMREIHSGERRLPERVIDTEMFRRAARPIDPRRLSFAACHALPLGARIRQGRRECWPRFFSSLL